MITLNLEDYCHEGCMRFEPRVIKGAYFMCDNIRVNDSTTTITCEHSAECQYMVRYLKKHGLETSDSDERRNNGSKDNENHI